MRKVFANFSGRERTFLGLAMLVGLLIGLDYAIIRPVSNSLFIHAYGVQAMPYAWLIALPFNLMSVAFYNRSLPKLGCFRLFCLIAGVIALGNTFAALWIQKGSLLPFFFYIWKEIYILLMLQQLWSVIHATISLKNARYLYGILFGFGALGGFLGSLVPGFNAVKFGSESLLFLTLPIYCLVTIAYFFLLKYANSTQEVKEKKMEQYASLSQGVKLIASSKLLLGIALMTVFMQITSTTTDFQFHAFLEKAYPEKDIRTEFFGRIFSIGNMLTMTFQFFGTSIFIYFLGLQRTHFLVPTFLIISALCFLCFPVFGPIACGFLLIKCFDFSLFGVIKEMLYIPMRLEEKFQAKALIDVFVYRSAKVFASLCISSLQIFFPAYILSTLSWVNIVIFILWAALIVNLRTSYRDSQEASSADLPH